MSILNASIIDAYASIIEAQSFEISTLTLKTISVLLLSDINMFLKNEAEIVTDFKTRIINAAKELDNLQAAAHITYNRIINKMNDAECMAFLSDRSLFMEENY